MRITKEELEILSKMFPTMTVVELMNLLNKYGK